MTALTDLDIARSVTPRPIDDIAAELGLRPDEIERYGPTKAQLAQPNTPGYRSATNKAWRAAGNKGEAPEGWNPATGQVDATIFDLPEVVAPEAAAVGRFRVAEVEIAGHPVVVAGTGYTGEDGVEIAAPVDAARAVWDLVLSAGVVPEPGTMGAIGALALLANVAVAVMLYAWREGDANMRSVWLCSRNDAIGNLAVMVAALGVLGTGSGWPDLAVAVVMGGLALAAAQSVIRQAWGELRPLAAPT